LETMKLLHRFDIRAQITRRHFAVPVAQFAPDG